MAKYSGFCSKMPFWGTNEVALSDHQNIFRHHMILKVGAFESYGLKLPFMNVEQHCCDVSCHLIVQFKLKG